MSDDAANWCTLTEAAEAAASVPGCGIPMTPAMLRAYAKRNGWGDGPAGENWCHRKGKGGGKEYHVGLLPARVKLALLKRREAPSPAIAAEATASGPLAAWRSATDSKRAKGTQRAGWLDVVIEMVRTGTKKTVAVETVARDNNVSPATIYKWDKLVRYVPRSEWAERLLPQHKGSRRRRELSEDAARVFRSMYLQPLCWSVERCIREFHKKARVEGWKVPSNRTLARLLNNLDPMAVALARKGDRSLDQQLPAQRRDRSELQAMEAVNADGHLFDVMCVWPDGSTGRPMLVGFQDLYSGMIVGWRLGAAETSRMVRLAFGEMAETYGVPARAFFDNGRAFASKENTGGAPNRYRFKMKPEEVDGVLTRCGTKVTFVKPEHGQSKPIERAFGDLAENIAKDIRCAGAYLGKNPLEKPADYGSRVVPIELFEQIVREGIDEHNNQPNRRSKVGQGKYSFRDVFEASLREHPRPCLSPVQRDEWQLGSRIVRVRTPDATVWIGRERYAQDDGSDLHRRIGERVTVRFNEDDPTADVMVLDDQMRLICKAQHIPDRAFMDADAAREDAERRGARKKQVRKLLRQLAPHSQDALVAMRVAAEIGAAADPGDPKIVRLLPKHAAVAPKPRVDEQPEWDEADIRFLRIIGENARALQRQREEG